MDRDLATLTALLLDPFLTRGEAEREASATPTRPSAERESSVPARRGDHPPAGRRPAPSLDF